MNEFKSHDKSLNKSKKRWKIELYKFRYKKQKQNQSPLKYTEIIRINPFDIELFYEEIFVGVTGFSSSFECASPFDKTSSSPVSARKSAKETTGPLCPGVRFGVFGELDNASKPSATLTFVQRPSPVNELALRGTICDVWVLYELLCVYWYWAANCSL